MLIITFLDPGLTENDKAVNVVVHLAMEIQIYVGFKVQIERSFI